MNGSLAKLIESAPKPEEASVLDLIIEHGRIARDPLRTKMANEMLEEFVGEVIEGSAELKGNSADLIARRIAEIDQMISDQVNAIMHHPKFKALESTWLGLKDLVKKADSAQDVVIKIIPATKAELLKDFHRAPGFDQSTLFKLIYEEEFGTLGGSPFAILVTDFSFGRAPQDISLLEDLSHVAAGAHAPLLTAADPKLFDLDSFTNLSAPRDMAKIFESNELAGWRSFRESDDSRYVVMTLPRVLMRLPYGPNTTPVEEFRFVEDLSSGNHEDYLWGSAAWSLASKIVESFGEYGWCAAIRGVEGGGKVEGLPLHSYRSVSGDVVTKCPTETAITDRREKELSDLGFLPLCYAKGTDYSVFFGGQTLHKPPMYTTEIARANARLSSMLPYILASSRFAHFLKTMMRDKVGAFQSKDTIETFLNQWITKYVTIDDKASHEVKARYPLREASIQVVENKDRPGAYSAVVFLRPHFQLEELSASIRLVAEIPKS